MESETSRYKPALDRRALVFLAGALWMLAGLILVGMALSWLAAGAQVHWAVLAAAGAACAAVARFGLARIVAGNLSRIRALPERPCGFAFMPARSYLLVAVMMGSGIALRHSSLPRAALAPVYLAMGAALLWSSLGYLRGGLAWEEPPPR